MNKTRASYRLAVFTANISHFEAPFYRALAANAAIDLTVYYFNDIGIAPRYDSLYARVVDWGVPLNVGFRSTFLTHPMAIVSRLIAHRYDALILYGYRSSAHISALLTSRLLGTKVLFRGTGTVLDKRSPLKRVIRKGLVSALARGFDGVLVGGKSNVEYYEDLGVPNRKMHFVPFSVDLDYFTSRCDAARSQEAIIKRRLALGDKTIVLFVGNFTKKKGPDVFVRAAEICLDKFTDVCFVLAGDGPLRNELEQYIRIRNLEPSVHILGFVPQSSLPELYAIVDCVVFPSLFDTWARAVNEAMACSLPIIASRKVGAVKDLVENDKNGLVVHEDDPVELADAIGQLLSCPDKLRAMGVASKEKISAWNYRLHIDAVLDALEV